MSLIEFDYGALNSAISKANSMSGGWGCYESYRSDIKSTLHGSLAEWQLAGTEPKGNAHVENARSEIDDKRADLETRKGEWSGLATNLGKLKTYVEQQDKNVADEFKNTSNQYTDYSGIGGAFTWLGDAFYDVFGVEALNSNSFTRGIADWGKSKIDDLHTVAQNVSDGFKHGNGRYVANIIGSLALTGAAIVGTVVAVIGIPFTGGSSAVIAVGCIGAIASGIGAAISAFNTYHTIKENAQALSIEDDPATARFHGDVSSYSEHVSKTKYSSPEEYQKYAGIAKGIDITEGVCTVVSITTGLATSFGTKSVEAVGEGGVVTKKTVFDFSPKNVKSNVLKTFGFKVEKESASITAAGQEHVVSVDTASDLGDTTIDIVSSSDDVQATSKTIEHTSKEIGNTKYTQRVKTVDKISVSSEYNSVVASNNVVTEGYSEYALQAERSTKTIDYTNAMMTKDKVSKISYLEKLNNASSASEATKLKVGRGLGYAEKGFKTISGASKTLTSGGKTATEVIYDIAKKNTVINGIDKYVYSLPTDSDATGTDYLKGIGGSNGGKVWSLYETISGKDAA